MQGFGQYMANLIQQGNQAPQSVPTPTPPTINPAPPAPGPVPTQGPLPGQPGTPSNPYSLAQIQALNAPQEASPLPEVLLQAMGNGSATQMFGAAQQRPWTGEFDAATANYDDILPGVLAGAFRR